MLWRISILKNIFIGFDYHCQIRDVFTNTVLASSQAGNMKKEVVLQILNAAQDRWHLPVTVIFHSDQETSNTADDVMTQVSIRPANPPATPSSNILRSYTTDAGYMNDWATKALSIF